MTNWKQTVAAAIQTPAPQLNPQGALAFELEQALALEQIAPASIAFAQSVLAGYQRYGSWTERQVAAVTNLLARSKGQAEPQPVEGPDAALAAALRAALPALAPSDVSFASSLLSGYDRFGSFTDRQRPYAEKLARSVPVMREAPSAPEKPAATLCPNICSKVNLNGFSRFTVGSLALSLKNDGSCIWVKWDGRIVGVIDSTTFELRTTRRYATQYAIDKALIELARVEADPLAAARENGVLTGRCSCCGRPLTDPTSIAYGIGPICRERGFGVRL